jgi:DNA invertase Pin-like site-specific DNA recombinase
MAAKAWAYIRVSTGDQENSIAVQTARIMEAAKRLDINLPTKRVIVDEDVSASIPLKNRPGGRGLWDSMDPGDTLIFLRVDRVFRSTRDAANTIHTWGEKGIRVVIVDLGIDLATAAGRMFFHQLAAFAEFEREMISLRTREVLARLKAQGKKYSQGRPFGWLWGESKRLVPYHEERRVGAVIVGLLDTGHSVRQVCWRLMQTGEMKPVDPSKRYRKPRDPGLKNSWLSLSEIHGLSIATRAGFPIEPRSNMTAAYLREKLTSGSSETPSRDPGDSPCE